MDSAEIERTRIIKYIKLQLTVMEQKKRIQTNIVQPGLQKITSDWKK